MVEHPRFGTPFIRISANATRADRCTYVYYGKQLPKSSPISEKKSSNTFDLEGAVDYLMDPVAGNNAKNRQVMLHFLFM